MFDHMDTKDLGLCPDRLARISTWMRDYVDSGKLPCAQVLVSRQGQLAFKDHYGLADIESKAALEEDSLYRIYSMTKPVTMVAILMLYERGLFQLDDPIERYLPEFSDMKVYSGGSLKAMRLEPARRPITIHDLLTHTSGLTYGFMEDSPVSTLYQEAELDFQNKVKNLRDTVRTLASLPLISHPGEAWNYSVSHDVVGCLIEELSGESLADFYQKEIFEPLGMTDTFFSVPGDKLHRLTSLYTPGDKGQLTLFDSAKDTKFTGQMSTYSGGGGLVSTAKDYLLFCEMLRQEGQHEGRALLSRKSVELMTSNHMAGDLAAMGQPNFSETTFEGIGFGLGLSVMLDPTRAKILGSPGEFAWGGAASTAFWVDPVEEMIVVLMTQLLPSSYYRLRRELRVLSYQALID